MLTTHLIAVLLVYGSFSGTYMRDCKDYKDLRKSLYKLQYACGNICDTSIKSEKDIHTVLKGKYFSEISKQYHCDDMFADDIVDPPVTYNDVKQSRHPPRLDELSADVVDLFTYEGRVKLFDHYFDHTKTKSKPSIWTEESIEENRYLFRNNKLKGNYKKSSVDEISRNIDEHMLEKVQWGNVLVIGSQNPWIEAILLEKGAKRVTTLEYEVLESLHPNVTVLTAEEIRRQYLSGVFKYELNRFDAMITFSSVEHSGLGRYGDSLNPWADLITMAQAKCIMKKGAKALIGVPSQFDDYGLDEYIGFNAGRVYGLVQLPHLFANWKLVYTEAIQNYHEMIAKEESKFNFGISIDHERILGYRYQPIYILQNG